MAIVNTNNYKEALKYLNNSSIYEQNKANINSVINYLDSRVLSVINEDLNTSKETFNNEIEAERTIKTTISTKIERYIEIESKARERAGLITGSVIGAAGAAVAMAAAPVAAPIVGAVAGVTAVGVTKKDATLQFFKDVGEAVFETGAKVVKKVGSFTLDCLTGIGNFFVKAGNAVAKIGGEFVSLCNKIREDPKVFFKTCANLITGACASLVNLVVSVFGEGVFWLGETIADCVVQLGGVAASLIFTAPYDLGSWIGSKIFKTEFQSATKSMWTKHIMPFVGKDYTTKTFDKLYETSFFQFLEDTSWGAFKRDGGTIYSIGKGIGYTVGLITITIATAGLGSSTVISSTIAGAGAMGKASQKNYNKLSDEEKQNMSSIAKVVGLSAASGLVEGAAWYFTFGGGKSKYVSPKEASKYMTGKTNLWNKGVDVVFNNKVTSKLPFGGLKKLLTSNTTSMAKMGIQFKKTYLNAIIDAGAKSKTIGEFGNAFVDDVLSAKTFSDAATNALVSLAFDNSFGKSGHALKNKQSAAAEKVAIKYELKAKQEQLEALNQQKFNITQTNATSSLFDSADDIVMEQAKQMAEIEAQKTILKKQIDTIYSIQNANSDGISKTVGGFIKKLMDIRKYPDMIEEITASEV